MRGVKPGVTGLAQINLEYTGKPRPGTELAEHVEALTNPFGLEGVEGALADDLRFKLLADVAYTAALEDFLGISADGTEDFVPHPAGHALRVGALINTSAPQRHSQSNSSSNSLSRHENS